MANVDVFKGLQRTTVSTVLRQYDGMHVVCVAGRTADRLCDVVSSQRNGRLDYHYSHKQEYLRSIEVMNTLNRSRAPCTSCLPHPSDAAQYLEHSDLLETSGLPAYIKDIRARLEQACDETNSLNKWLERLRDESDRLLSERHSSILYSLTVVTTLFLPGEFLAAVFGMNFYNMPLIHYKYGYPLFWGSVILVILFLFFRKKNLL